MKVWYIRSMFPVLVNEVRRLFSAEIQNNIFNDLW